MNFMDAVTRMQNGNMASRPKMNAYYLTILPNQTYIYSVGLGGATPTVNVSLYTPSVDDIQATDWVTK